MRSNVNLNEAGIGVFIGQLWVPCKNSRHPRDEATTNPHRLRTTNLPQWAASTHDDATAGGRRVRVDGVRLARAGRRRVCTSVVRWLSFVRWLHRLGEVVRQVVHTRLVRRWIWWRRALWHMVIGDASVALFDSTCSREWLIAPYREAWFGFRCRHWWSRHKWRGWPDPISFLVWIRIAIAIGKLFGLREGKNFLLGLYGWHWWQRKPVVTK